MTQQEFIFAKAAPTKAFFIEMLTRDISLLRAIVDLVDNCVDGAIRMRGWAGENLEFEEEDEEEEEEEDDEEEDDEEEDDEEEDDEEEDDEEEEEEDDEEEEEGENEDGENEGEADEEGVFEATETRPFAGLRVSILTSSSEFKISDNCGGILIELARDYAFCFGRPTGMAATDHSIGQFGVGMKRALFKLGRQIDISSCTSASEFSLSIDVDKWQVDKEWAFPFGIAKNDCENPDDSIGTAIHVTRLHRAVASEFKLENFGNRLMQEISAAHQNAIAKGLTIEINGIPVEPFTTELLQSKSLIPGKKVRTFGRDSGAPVKVRLLAGIADSDPQRAGWYVFCNGRMVVVADRTEMTGWGATHESRIPRYHNQFSRFRGYAYFECIDASKLPWNTTKTGVDEGSPIYRRTRETMILLTRPVIDFLNDLDREKNEGIPQVLTLLIGDASPVPATSVDTRKKFTFPPPREFEAGEDKLVTRRIQYDKPASEIEEVMDALEVSTLKEVGEMTFDYYRDLEVE